MFHERYRPRDMAGHHEQAGRTTVAPRREPMHGDGPVGVSLDIFWALVDPIDRPDPPRA